MASMDDIDLNAPWNADGVPEEAVPMWGECPQMYLSYGVATRNDRLPMLKDAIAAVKSFTVLSPPMGLDFFGVFDGILGAKFAEHMEERLHVALANDIERDLRAESPRPRDDVESWWRATIVDAFRVVGSQAVADGGNGVDAPAPVGSGALVALVLEDYFVLANRGVSRAVIYRGYEAVPLTPEQRPMPRNAGGDVVGSTCRVQDVMPPRAFSGSSKFRAAVPEPEVIAVKRKPGDKFLILATRGLWDFVTPGDACAFIERRLSVYVPRIIMPWEKKPTNSSGPPCAKILANELAEHAISKGTKHNVNIVVILLKNFWDQSIPSTSEE
ncbi:protein phosphatase 2C 56-like [Hordeum vulgare subsp. vulgare]|uniref:protein-serine/threonine phosphatase n=1 Tax=Hordeum vulgare subsp. vulgare TaxID=112509 RepID=A0A8I6WZY2_HORVV|nr:protein phosphatase 2C 56-like [Hordeum vulgare subsp. vulgare]